MSRFREVLGDKNFFSFWLGQIVSQFGDRLNQMALISLVFTHSRGSAFALAKVMSLTIIPSFIVSPFAGAFVDRWNRKTTMIVTDLIRAVLVLMLPFLVNRFNSFVPLYIIVFLVFSTSCFFIPSKFSLIPQLVNKEKILIANSLTNTTMMLAAVLGVGLGGQLIEKTGPEFGFYLDAATYIFSALLLSIVAVRFVDKSKSGTDGEDAPFKLWQEHSIFREIRDGIRHVFRHPYMRFVFFTIFLLMAAAGALYIVGIVFIQRAFGSITRDLGVLSVFLGAGFFVGALICGRLGDNFSKAKIIFISLILSGISIACFALILKFHPVRHLAIILSIITGICVGPIFIASNTLIHSVIKDKMMGRIFSSLGIVMNLGFLIFMFVASKFSEFYNPMDVILAISLLLICYGLWGVMTFRGKL